MQIHVSKSGIPVARPVVVFVAVVLSLVLTLTIVPDGAYATPKPSDPATTAAAKAAKSVDAPADSDDDGIFDRPDMVSAALTARLSKKPVEDLSARTESSSTIVNPDGTFTRRQFTSPVRLQDAADVWEPVDYDLEKQDDGSYAPKVVPADVRVSGGGDLAAASVGFTGDQALAVTVPDKLPTPTIEGGVATYQLSATTDLLVVTTGGGVAVRLRVKERPATDDEVYSLGLRTDSLSVKTTAAGALTVADEAGKQVGTTAHLKAWDAQVDSAGDPINVVALDADLTKGATAGDVTNQVLDLRTPEGFLSDPGTKYPVIIDPDINAVSFTRDTWIRDPDAAVYGTDYRLLVGSIHGVPNPNQTYSMLQWSNSQLAGKDITKATMGLYQYDANSCDPKQMNIDPLAAGFTEGSAKWSNRPGIQSTDGVSVSENRGGSLGTGCTSNGFITADVTGMAQKWAQGTTAGGYTNYGIRLSVPAASASDTSFERRFCSSEPDSGASSCNTSARVPYLNITYNSPPAKTSKPSIDQAVSVGSGFVVATTTPTVSTVVSDPEKSPVRARFKVSQGSTVAFEGITDPVASGGTAKLAIGSGLVDGGTYTIQA